MKQLLMITIWVLLLGGMVKAQSVKTLVMSLPAPTQLQTKLTAAGDVSTKEWNKDYIRLSVTISTNTSEEILGRLIAVGRYQATTHEADGSYYIDFPKMDRSVTVKGVKVKEELSFELLVPYGSSVESISRKNKVGM